MINNCGPLYSAWVYLYRFLFPVVIPLRLAIDARDKGIVVLDMDSGSIKALQDIKYRPPSLVRTTWLTMCTVCLWYLGGSKSQMNKTIGVPTEKWNKMTKADKMLLKVFLITVFYLSDHVKVWLRVVHLQWQVLEVRVVLFDCQQVLMLSNYQQSVHCHFFLNTSLTQLLIANDKVSCQCLKKSFLWRQVGSCGKPNKRTQDACKEDSGIPLCLSFV